MSNTTMTAKMAGLPMAMNHPVLGCPATAGIVARWYEHGRWTGYVLQFAGERKTRHLRFKEIRDLQNGQAAEEAAKE
jgi:hypothetical protein